MMLEISKNMRLDEDGGDIKTLGYTLSMGDVSEMFSLQELKSLYKMLHVFLSDEGVTL